MICPQRRASVFDEARTRRAVAVIAERCGFEVSLVRGSWKEAVAQIGRFSPQLVIVDLPSVGVRGLGIIEDLQTTARMCTVVLLAPFEGLRDSALDAGAYELIGKEDLRDLDVCLRRLAAELSARDVAALCSEPDRFITSASQWHSEQESLLLVREVPPVGPGEAPRDWQPQAGTASPVQAHETIEDLLR
jgi:DNA-binding response OmpR family regulator